MKKNKVLALLAFAAAAGFSSCKKDEPAEETPVTPVTTYDNGVFVTNEGPFGSGTGTVDFYSRSSSDVSNDIFQAKNGYPLGNIVQSIEVHNSKAYIVVNNAGKIEVADGSTFAATGTITGFTYPRFFKGISSTKAYVSEWGSGGVSGNVKVVNLSSNTITATLPTGKGAEAILVTGGKAYVACGGGFDNDSVVTVIDANADTVMNSIVVGPNPKNLVKDANGDIWILCAGAWDPTFTFLQYPGRLVRINASTGAITLSLPFSSGYSQPSSLVSNSAGTTLYFNYDGGIYSHNVTSSTLSGSPIIPRAFYSLGLDPVSGHLFAGDAGNFSSNGKVLRYTTAGAVVDSFATGIIPGNFYFK